MYGMYLSASGAQAYSQYLDVLSNNIANADTPGFKRQIPVLQARAAEAIEQGLMESGQGQREDVGGGVYLSSTPTEFAVGAVASTGNPTDLALADTEGKSFFVLQGDGEKLLTRAGNFYKDLDGYVRSQDGRHVLNTGGTPVSVDPRYPFEVSSDGIVSQRENRLRVPLAIEQPGAFSDLEQVGSNSFRSKSKTFAAPPEDRQVRQGFLEKSSTQPMQEMVEMIKASRAYEANIRMIQNQDSTMESLIGRVLSGE